MRIEDVSARALRYWENRQAAIANNLANASTPGFKAERVFARLLSEADLVAGSKTDFSSGSVVPTGRPMDVALLGDGFLAVEGPGGTPRWIRGGSLALGADGSLIDPEGRPVLGSGGPIVVPNGALEITDGGEVRVDGEVVDRLRIERPQEGATVVREGSNLWIPTEPKEEVLEGVRVRQGYLEESNVDPVTTLVEMIEIQRAYTAVQRSIQTEDAVMQSITTEIGRVG